MCVYVCVCLAYVSVLLRVFPVDVSAQCLPHFLAFRMSFIRLFACRGLDERDPSGVCVCVVWQDTHVCVCVVWQVCVW